MPRKPRPWLPITPATVTIDGSDYSALNHIWSMLRLNEGVAKMGWSSRDPVLSVPMCHPADDVPSSECGWSRIRPKDKYEDYRFARQRNGAWMLVLEVSP